MHPFNNYGALSSPPLVYIVYHSRLMIKYFYHRMYISWQFYIWITSSVNNKEPRPKTALNNQFSTRGLMYAI